MAKKGYSSVSVKRGKELADKLKSYSSKAETNLEKAVLKGGLMVEASARRKSPVDTGYNRASITHQFYKNNGDPTTLVGTNTEYAPWLEEGTSKMAPQPFLRPAFEENINDIKEEIGAALKWK